MVNARVKQANEIFYDVGDKCAVVELFKIEKGLLYFKGFKLFVLAFKVILENIKFNSNMNLKYFIILIINNYIKIQNMNIVNPQD